MQPSAKTAIVTPSGITVSRIAGASRYDVSNAIALAGFPSHADTVFVTTGTNYPDALSAAPAAIAAHAPLLLTTPDQLLPSVAKAIAALTPNTIVMVGGGASLSPAVERSLKTLARSVVRIAGSDRYNTSHMVADYAFGRSGASTAYVATGTNFPDALSAGSAAGSAGAPVILVNGPAPQISAQTSTLISSLGVSSVKIAGGPASVSNGVQSSLTRQASTTRLSGADRFSTGAAINSDAYSTSTTAYLASGYNFPDALAGSTLAGISNAPLFIVPPQCVPQNILDELKSLAVQKVVVLGGTSALSPAVESLVSCTPPPPSSSMPPSSSIPASSSMPVGNLPGWRQVGAQDFTATAATGQIGNVYGTAVRGYSGLLDTSKNGTYNPDSVLSVSNGILDFYLHTASGRPQVAAAVPFGYSGQTYGRYSIRFRSDSLPGYKIAFLLWPSSDNWNEGEIDWPEGDLNGKMSPASAIKGSYTSTSGMAFDAVSPRSWSATDSSNWHIATTEWTPGSVKWYWDGVLVSQTSNRAGVPNTNFRWTLQAETQIGAPAPAPSVAGHLQVDWAVQYAYAP
ncbi:cell wall-binding repeat-containing protein [Parafrigoribacterium soli]|uniref:cell wall-binding repeat-containing protein n=1 Tax=Parafrigoribacterium soli TaxID=3144663 RepID=UPI0032EF7162